MSSIQPNNATPLEKNFEETGKARLDMVNSAVPSIRTAKHVTRPPSFLPFLVYEFGLGQLTPYVPNIYNLLDEGVRWQRLRGTYAGVAKGLSFLSLTATVIPAWSGREWWNSAQLNFNTLPENDSPLLNRIEGITELSLPKRSDFRRGVHVYDAQPLECDGSCLDHSLLEFESGTRIRQDGALWSFGRVTEIEHVLTEEEGNAIGNWLAPTEEDGIKWTDMTYPWVTAAFLWASNPAAQRRSLLASWFADKRLFATLRDSNGDIIGHRACRAVWPVNEAVNGVYSFAGKSYRPDNGGQSVYIEALTEFDQVTAIIAASVELTVGASLADGVPLGRSWLAVEELIGGTPIAVAKVNLPLRHTVREQIKFHMRF